MKPSVNLIAVLLCVGIVSACSTSFKERSAGGVNVSLVATTKPIGNPIDSCGGIDALSLPTTLTSTPDDSLSMTETADTQMLDAIVVSAKYNNVAERGGKLNILFDVCVPVALQDSKWQVRIEPALFFGEDSLPLDRVFITGSQFRKQQEKGYKKYQKYFESIIPDSVDFVEAFAEAGLLEIFTGRNVEKNFMGITYDEAVEHYIKYWLVHSNSRRRERLAKMFKKYVKIPRTTERLRLDTIITEADGTLRYTYSQTVRAIPGIKKLSAQFTGYVYSIGGLVYTLPKADPLTFYVTSLAQLADTATLYMDKIVERRVTLSRSAFVDFKCASWEIDTSLSSNASELLRIREDLTKSRDWDDFIIDSVVITAGCSPEGSYSSNALLAKKRVASARDYFIKEMDKKASYRIIMHSVAEDWEGLRKYIDEDTTLRERGKLLSCFDEKDPDRSERALSRSLDYPYLREKIYPKLRKIDFTIYLCRRGMQRDTIHTTSPDTLYMRGVEALLGGSLPTAARILSRYRDFNSALALLSLDYNGAAIEILKDLKQTPKVKYTMAVAYMRVGEDSLAIEKLKEAVAEEPSLIYRGNLDPEVAPLVSRIAVSSRRHPNGAD